MDLSVGARWTLALIVAMLGCILGLTAANSGTQVVYKNAPAAAASSPQATPKVTMPAMPKNFAVAHTVTTESGYKLTSYTCAPGLTTVDVLGNGKSVTYGDTTEQLVNDDDMSGKTLTLTLGKATALPGIIVHLFTTSDDAVNPDGLSDKTMSTQLLPGQKLRYDLRYEDFVYYDSLDGVRSVTLCMS